MAGPDALVPPRCRSARLFVRHDRGDAAGWPASSLLPAASIRLRLFPVGGARKGEHPAAARAGRAAQLPPARAAGLLHLTIIPGCWQSARLPSSVKP